MNKLSEWPKITKAVGSHNWQQDRCESTAGAEASRSSQRLVKKLKASKIDRNSGPLGRADKQCDEVEQALALEWQIRHMDTVLCRGCSKFIPSPWTAAHLTKKQGFFPPEPGYSLLTTNAVSEKIQKVGDH